MSSPDSKLHPIISYLMNKLTSHHSFMVPLTSLGRGNNGGFTPARCVKRAFVSTKYLISVNETMKEGSMKKL